MDAELLNIRYLKGKSIVSIKGGYTPLLPKYRKTFFDPETSSVWSVTDLDLKKQKRTCALIDFRDTYSRLYALNRISLFTIIVSQKHYPTIKKFLNTITNKFKRKGIAKLGHVWVRDIGNIKFDKHFHILIATEIVSRETFQGMFNIKKHNKYEIEFIKTPEGIVNYLKSKELYASKRERTYQKSREFSKPKAL
jgi:hypothetical protein